MGTSVESEAKWQADRAFAMPDLSALRGVSATPEAEAMLRAGYYDTHDMSLLRLGVTLRLRTGEGAERWTLKLPTAPAGRLLRRHEVDFAVAGLGPPPAARRVLGAILAGRRLHRVCVIETRRRVYPQVDAASGSRLGELCDDRVHARGRHLAVRAFREVELEVSAPAGAAAGLVRRVGRVLERSGARAEAARPKFQRVVWGASRPHGPATDPKVLRLGDIVSQALEKALDRLLAHDPAVRLNVDPEAVHQARVAVRQLRSQLRTFRRLLDPTWTRAARTELKALGAALGAVRDLDVLSAWLMAPDVALPAGDQPALASLVEAAARERATAYRRLEAFLRSARYRRLIAALRRVAADPPLAGPESELPAVDALPDVLGRPLVRLRRAVKALSPNPGREELHRLRILTKRARYAFEAAEPALGRRAQRLADALADLQGELGEVQDAAAAEAWLRRWALTDPAVALVGGELLAARRRAADQAIERWPKAWRQVRREFRRSAPDTGAP